MPVLALLLSGALFVSGLSVPAGAEVSTGGGGETKVTLFPVSVSQTNEGSVGGAHPVTIHLRRTGGKEFRVGFSEDEVAGTGDQWRAAGWNAATVATLLTGESLGGNQITFDVSGRIDGPSAGALMTIGVLSLLRGDKVQKDITMTGTINPDGTVGPVGGIPYKLDGAVEANKSRMLIPIGQRNSTDDTGALVDVVDLGSEKGVDVSEVGDIYTAYEEFTGKELPRPDSGGAPELSSDAYNQLETLANQWLAEFDAQAGQFNALDVTIQESLLSIADLANEATNRAQTLSQQGLQAGAYVSALEAAAYARAGVTTGQALQIYLTQGLDPFISQIEASVAIGGKVDALIEKLKSQKPKTVSDASALIDSYGYGLDAIALTQFAENLFAASNEAATEDEALTSIITGAVFYEFAGTLVDSANELYELGEGSGGARLKPDIAPSQAADFFRKAAEANFQAFDTIIVEPEANAAGVSSDQVRVFLSGNDFEYALAQATFQLIESEGLESALGGGNNAAYGDLGGSIALYSRTSSLISKYYALNVELDENFEPIATSNERALTAALEFGQDQVERSVALLDERKVNATLEVGAYEDATIDREGDLTDKLSALNGFLSSFIKSRVLAYLGGFQTDGLS